MDSASDENKKHFYNISAGLVFSSLILLPVGIMSNQIEINTENKALKTFAIFIQIINYGITAGMFLFLSFFFFLYITKQPLYINQLKLTKLGELLLFIASVTFSIPPIITISMIDSKKVDSNVINFSYFILTFDLLVFIYSIYNLFVFSRYDIDLSKLIINYKLKKLDGEIELAKKSEMIENQGISKRNFFTPAELYDNTENDAKNPRDIKLKEIKSNNINYLYNRDRYSNITIDTKLDDRQVAEVKFKSLLENTTDDDLKGLLDALRLVSP